jgi:cytoskeletal protein CcmA (bactofilin family)
MSDSYKSDRASVLGPTLVFKGELSSEEDLVLKGRVEGSISNAPNLRIGEEGSVKGDVRANYVTVEGKVEGDLNVSSFVTVEASANVKGNIFSPKVSLIEGARFKGSIDMDAAESSAASPRPKTEKTSDAKSTSKVA